MNSSEWNESPGLNEEERKILQQVCEDVGVPSTVVERMIAAEQKVYGMGRRHGIKEALEVLVSEGIKETEGMQ